MERVFENTFEPAPPGRRVTAMGAVPGTRLGTLRHGRLPAEVREAAGAGAERRPGRPHRPLTAAWMKARARAAERIPGWPGVAGRADAAAGARGGARGGTAP